MSKLYYFFLLVAILQVVPVMAQDKTYDQLAEIAVIDQKVMMPMRDGIRLCTDIYRPKTDQPVPVIFVRTPYNFNLWGDGEMHTRTLQNAKEAVEHGYAYVIQNERGRYFSEGEWDILGVPTTDGYDAFSWMAQQPWCNGRVGTLGCSSTAEWQMAIDVAQRGLGVPEVELAFLRAYVAYRAEDYAAMKKHLERAKQSKLLDERARRDVEELAAHFDPDNRHALSGLFDPIFLARYTISMMHFRFEQAGLYEALEKTPRVQAALALLAGVSELLEDLSPGSLLEKAKSL